MEDLPMLPGRMKLVVIGQTSKQFKAVSSLLSSAEVSDIVIATDGGARGRACRKVDNPKGKLPQADAAALDILTDG